MRHQTVILYGPGTILNLDGQYRLVHCPLHKFARGLAAFQQAAKPEVWTNTKLGQYRKTFLFRYRLIASPGIALTSRHDYRKRV